jgi:hypothetical protein
MHMISHEDPRMQRECSLRYQIVKRLDDGTLHDSGREKVPALCA